MFQIIFIFYNKWKKKWKQKLLTVQCVSNKRVIFSFFSSWYQASTNVIYTSHISKSYKITYHKKFLLYYLKIGTLLTVGTMFHTNTICGKLQSLNSVNRRSTEKNSFDSFVYYRLFYWPIIVVYGIKYHGSRFLFFSRLVVFIPYRDVFICLYT